ncbi:MAG TPA: ABC transporter permease [Elusimicrobiota bacterium]|nr:ABC transporter permease [Elusimicrobiota bacterium]
MLKKFHQPYYTYAHYLNQIKELTRCEFKLRDQSTLLGFLWTLLNPLLMFLVLYLLFIKWMGNHVHLFQLYLIVGVVQWGYMTNATSCGMRSVIQKSSLVKNFIFPHEVIVLSSVLTITLIHLLELLVMMGFLLFWGANMSLKWLWLPVVVFIETMMVTGVALFLSRWAVEYKDTDRIWSIVIQAAFFVTPVFYPETILSPGRRQIIMLNPMALLIKQTREFMVYDRAPSLLVLGFLFALSAGILLTGYYYFKRGEPHFAEKFP